MFRAKTRVAQLNTLSEPGMPVQLKLESFGGFELWHSDAFNVFVDTDYIVAMTAEEFSKLDRILAVGPEMEGMKPPDTAKLLGSVYEFFSQKIPSNILGQAVELVAVQLTEIWARHNQEKLKEGGDTDG